MNIALWIAAGLLAASFLGGGLAKVLQPREKLLGRMVWAEDFTDGQVKAIGAVEALGAVGLILPAVTGIAPVLVPIAATGLVITMLLAAAVHVRRGERNIIGVNLALAAIAAFVAWGRFGPYAF
ncbi:MAG: DoxX family protein [Candidatus Phosphoribacter sp.]|nr:DoxX family protein [Actinomycetales bacterium]